MNLTKKILLFILLSSLFCYAPTFGQKKFDLEDDFNAQYQLKNWNADNHNFSNSVLSVIQSDLGHLWVGTFDGLYRFDGLDFTRIDTDKNHSNLFPNHTFWTILEDSKQNLWFGSNGGGLVIYDSKSRKYKKLQDERIANEIIISLFEDSKGIIWAGTRKYLLKIENEKVEIVHLKDFPTVVVRSFWESKEGILWLGTQDNGLLAIKKGKVIKHYDIKSGLASNQVYSLFIDHSEKLWVGTTKGLFTLENEKLIPQPLHAIKSNSFPVITALYQSKDKEIFWVATEEGLVHIKNNKQSFVEDLPNQRVTALYEDKENNIWIGTYREGLVRLKKSDFFSYTVDKGLVSEVVNCVFETNEKSIWIGTNKGISVWNDNVFTNYKLKDARVRAFSPDGNKIWIATYGGVLYYQDGEIQPFEANSKLKNNRIRSIFYDKNEGNLWIGSSQGLHCYTSEKEMIVYGEKELGNANIMSINPSAKGLAISTNGGGVVFYKDEKFEAFTSQEGLSGNVVFGVYQDKQNNIWVSTNGGLSLFQGDKLTNFTTSTGFYSNTVFQTLEDENEKLWFYSNNSIFYYNKQALLDFANNKKEKITPRIFTANDGLPSNITGAATGFKTKDNWLAFPCLKGVAFVKPSYLEINKHEPKSYIEKIELDGQLVESEKEGSEIEIPAETRRINIFYTALSYSNPKKIIFRYRLHPFEEEWIETSIREISYTNLPSGKYTFQLEVSNGEGLWAKKGLSVQFKQKGHFYTHPLFYPALFLILTAIGFFIYFYRLNYYKKAKSKLENLVSQRTASIQRMAQEIQYSYTKVSDSIRYAKRIQDAILQNDALFKSTFASHFIFWRAKDVVSGDFYWSSKEGNKTIIVVGDCTGHGVPGAFMTILGSSSLDKIVHKDDITDPAAILQVLDTEITQALSKNITYKNNLNEGMDVSVCIIDYDKKEFLFAGAKSRAFYFHDDKMTELNGDRTSIGEARKKAITFKTQKFDFIEGDRLYLFSDGYYDQFGGEDKSSKYLIKRLRKFINSIQNLAIQEQKIALVKELEDWQGETTQIDDIIFVGMEL